MLLLIHFLYPGFLYGLFILAVPILLHFFSFKRYKKIYFSNFNFLASLQQQKKNSSKLKNLLLLLLRLLVLSAIVLAFANPYLASRAGEKAGGEKAEVVIYLDNSFSMSNTGSQGTLLEEAKHQLFDIVNAYPAGVSFTLLTNDPHPPVQLTRDEILSTAGSVKTSAATKKLSRLFKEVRELAPGKRTTFFLISDFQTHNGDFQHIVPDTLTEPIFLVLQPENRNNLYIKEVSFLQPFHKKDQNDKLSVRIVNSSPQDFTNVPVSLTLNGKKKSIHKVNLPADSEQTVEISYLNSEDGFYKGIAEISDFPLIFDNKFYFSYQIDDKINILCIEQEKHCPYFGKLFSDTASYSLSYININQTARINFHDYHLVILDRLNISSTGLESALENYVLEGGKLFVLPGEKLSAKVANQLLQKMHAARYGEADTNTTVSAVETQASLFKDVFEKQEEHTLYPSIRHFYRLLLPENCEKLLVDKKGNTLLSASSHGKGNLYVSAFSYDPENSDMVFHPLFVPLLVNMAYNMSSGLNVSYTIHSGLPVLIHDKDRTTPSSIKVRKPENGLEFIAGIRKEISGNLILQNTENLQEAGLYEIISENRTIDLVACNYDRTESRLQFCDIRELQKQFPSARVENIKTTQFDRNSETVRSIVEEDNNKYLSRYFLLLAVLALFAEQAIWKKRFM